MEIASSLKLALKSSELIVRQYVINLESQNAKLQKEIAKLEAQNIGQKNEISALKKELRKGKKVHVKVSFSEVKPTFSNPAVHADAAR